MGKQSAIISQEGGFDEIEEREAFLLSSGGVPCVLDNRFGSPRVTNARRMASPRPRRVLTRTPHRHITPPIPRFPQHRRGAYRARRIVHVSSAHGGVSQSVARQITSARTDSRGRRRRTSTSPPRASALASRSSPRAAMERTWGRRAGGFGSRRARGDRSASAGSGAADETRDASSTSRARPSRNNRWTHPARSLPPFFAFTNLEAGDMFESVGLRNLGRATARGRSGGGQPGSRLGGRTDRTRASGRMIDARASFGDPGDRGRPASVRRRRAAIVHLAHLASSVFFPTLTGGAFAGMAFASLCASAVGDSARGT